jgi:hypothetical protein
MSDIHSDEFKKVMLGFMQTLQGDVNRLRASVEDLKLTVDKHDQLLRWVLGVQPLSDHLHADTLSWRASANNETVPCRKHASSMMTLREIQEDFRRLGRMANHSEGGDCRLAAAEAWEFFDRTHRPMSARLVDGVLYAKSGAKAVMGKSGKIPAENAGVSPNMAACKLLRGNCVWVPDEDDAPAMNTHGMAHRVTVVTTLEGKRIVVDWGIGQFSYLPDDIRLYVEKADLN